MRRNQVAGKGRVLTTKKSGTPSVFIGRPDPTLLLSRFPGRSVLAFDSETAQTGRNG